MSQVCRDSSGAVSSNWTEHLVKGPDDLEAFSSIFEDELIEPDHKGVEHMRQRCRLIGDDGIIIGSMAGTPLGMMYRVYSGVATLSYLWADAPKALRDCFSVMEKSYLRNIHASAQYDVDAVVSMDDTSTTAISPAMFEEFNMELTDRRADATHAAEKFHDASPGSRFIVGMSADPYHTMEEMRFIAGECRRHQRMYDTGREK